MIDPAVFIGAPIRFENICQVYPPTVKEVVTNPIFNTCQRIITITYEELQREQKKNNPNERLLTPFEYLLSCAYQDIKFKIIAQQAFMIFINEPVVFLYEEKKVLIGYTNENIPQKISEPRYIDEENYFDFQNAIRIVSGVQEIKPPVPDDPDEDPRITAIKKKARERDLIKATQKNKDGIHFSTCLAAICCMGIGITPLNIGELSYASIGTIMNMMQEKEKYDIDIRSLLAGASSKKVKPKYWIRNHDN